MRWSSAYTATILSGLFQGRVVDSFAVRSSQRQVAQHSSALSIGGVGWDNEDFLEGLGNGEDAQNDANDKYYRHARMGRPDSEDAEEGPPSPPADDGDVPEEGIAGASLTSEMVEKAKASHTPEDEASGGGKMFRELKRRAEEAAKQGFNKPPPYLATPPPVASDPMAAAAAAADPSQLSVEQQAALFRQMMQQNQQGAADAPVANIPHQTMPPPVPSRQPRGNAIAADGKRIGRNRDADAIVNSADVYFAQLKKDSAVRNEARWSGDEERSEAVFADPSLADIKLHVNPYLEEAREKERAMLETSADEMILPSMFVDRKGDKPKSYSGISFKERLKAKRSGIPPSSTAQSPPTAEKVEVPEPTVAAVPPPAAAAPPPPTAPVETVSQVSAPVEVEPPAAAQAPTTPRAPVESSTTPPTAPADVYPVASASSASAAPAPRPEAGSEDMRTEMRTLMGLLMKHKGGPGFGVGRIIGAERERFEALASSLTATLRDEAMLYPDDLVGEGIDLQVQSGPAAISASQSTTAPSGTAVSPASTSDVDAMISCIEGAVQMYKNSPPELHESVITTLRAALLSAVNTCNDIVGDDTPVGASSASGSPAQPQSERMTAMVSCIEGAIQMYKNSPAEIRSSVLTMLRAALLSAIGTCNAVIADNEVQNVQAYQATAAVEAPKPPVAEPVPEETVAAPATETHPGDDPNTSLFVDVYEKLSNAAGDGGLGLRQDLSPEEASSLADGIADARVLLVDELDNGIPKSDSNESASSTGSKYQQLLAKARAAKK